MELTTPQQESNEEIPPQPKRPKRIWKVLKRIFLWTSVSLIALFLVGTAIIFIYGDEIKAYVLKKVNEQLNVHIEAKDISFSVFSKFPFASVELKDVTATSTGSMTGSSAGFAPALGDTLLYAGHLYFLFNIYDVFNKKYEIHELDVDNGFLHLFIDAKGKDNFHVVKEQPSDTSSRVSFKIRKFKLSEMQLSCDNEKDHWIFDGICKKATLGGDFASNQYTLETNINVNIIRFAINNINYLNQCETNIKFSIAANKKEAKYNFEKSILVLGGIPLLVSGEVTDQNNKTLFNLKVKAENFDLEKALKFIPTPAHGSGGQAGESFDWLKKSRGGGDCNLNASIVGTLADPLLEMDFTVQGGRIFPSKPAVELRNIILTGKYSNKLLPHSGNSFLEIKEMKATIDGQEINVNLSLENPDNPVLNIFLETELKSKTIAEIFRMDTLLNIQGSVAIHALARGRLNDFENDSLASPLKNFNSKGTLTLKDVGFKIKGREWDCKKLNGKCNFQNNHLLVENVNAMIGKSDITISGTFMNFLNFVFSDTEHLNLVAKLSSTNLYLDEMLASAGSATDANDAYNFGFLPRVDAELNAQVSNFYFEKFRAQNIAGNLIIKNKILTTDAITFTAMNGRINVNGSIDATSSKNMLIRFNAGFAGIDIKELFFETGSFGQTTLTDKNLKGELSASLTFGAVINNHLVFDDKRIVATSHITIKNGELLNFKPAYKLSKFVKLSELEDIKFQTLENDIEIHDRKIFIPKMDIHSSAMDLTISGTHDFDNKTDYKIKILMSELLGRKLKQNSTEFGEVEDDGYGKTTLFLTMKGDVDNPEIKYDKKAVLDKLAAPIIKDYGVIKNWFNNLIGKGSKDSVKTDTKPELAPEENKPKPKIQIDYGTDETPPPVADSVKKKLSKTGQAKKDAFSGKDTIRN